MVIFAMLFGLVFVAVGIYSLKKSLRLRTKGRFTVGTITRWRYRGRSISVFVTFKISKKRKVEFDAGGGSFVGMMYQVGQLVPVLYNPRNPLDAVIYSWEFMWATPLAFIAAGIVFFLSPFFAHWR
jgi:hypothetical protein